MNSLAYTCGMLTFEIHLIRNILHIIDRNEYITIRECDNQYE